MINLFTPDRNTFYKIKLTYEQKKLKIIDPIPLDKNTYKRLQFQLDHYKIPTHILNVIVYLYDTVEEMDTHLLYRGEDKTNKIQYIYGKSYTSWRKDNKSVVLKAVLKHIVNIKKYINKHLTGNSDFESVISLLLAVELEFFIRMGKPIYEELNKTTGLCTLRRFHFTLLKTKVQIKFTGKDNLVHQFNIPAKSKLYNPIIKNYNQIKDIKDYFFKYQTTAGRWITVSPVQINNILNQLAGGTELTLKDIRAYGVNYLFVKNRINGHSAKQALELTAGQIGHTPTICKKSYLVDRLYLLTNDIYEQFKKVKSIDHAIIQLMRE